MRWLIKNPAPEDERKEKWGDFHFGSSLSKYLERLGETVVTQYWGDWENREDFDILLVLRGKHRYIGVPSEGKLRILWNISHPSDVSIDEMEEYDVVAVASTAYADFLEGEVNARVIPLLQCTDTELFSKEHEASARERRGFVFVGNTREVLRPGVLWAVEYGLPLRVWGRGWKRWAQVAPRVVGQYVRNEDLGKMYAQSRVTINDHWDDMKRYGYINNRIFDALACGLPVVSDWHSELVSLFPEEVLYYSDRADFWSCMERLLLQYPEVQRLASVASNRIYEEFSFEKRAQELADLAHRCRS